jgi:hypothetical protein
MTCSRQHDYPEYTAGRTSNVTQMFLLSATSRLDTNHTQPPIQRVAEDLSSGALGEEGEGEGKYLGYQSHLRCVAIKNAWSCAPLPTYVFIVLCLQQSGNVVVTMRMEVNCMRTVEYSSVQDAAITRMNTQGSRRRYLREPNGWLVMCLERGPLVSTTEELFERKSNSSGLETR